MRSQVDEGMRREASDHVRPLSRRTFVRLTAAAVGVAISGSAHAQAVDPGSSLVQQGRKYLEGDGVLVNFKKASDLFQQAADAGSLDGQAWLGSMYLRGRGIAQDQTKGASLIKASAEAGSPVGLRFMGVLYQQGRTVPRITVRRGSSMSKQRLRAMPWPAAGWACCTCMAGADGGLSLPGVFACSSKRQSGRCLPIGLPVSIRYWGQEGSPRSAEIFAGIGLEGISHSPGCAWLTV